MIREEKVSNAKSLSETIMLLSKSQLDRFSAVVAWYQIHNKFYYFLDERETKKLFVDLVLSKKFRRETISERRKIVLDHFVLHMIEGRQKVLLRLAKAAARRKSVRELNEIARGTFWDERD